MRGGLPKVLWRGKRSQLDAVHGVWVFKATRCRDVSEVLAPGPPCADPRGHGAAGCVRGCLRQSPLAGRWDGLEARRWASALPRIKPFSIGHRVSRSKLADEVTKVSLSFGEVSCLHPFDESSLANRVVVIL